MTRMLTVAALTALPLFVASNGFAQESTGTTVSTTPPPATATATTAESPALAHPVSVSILAGYGFNNIAGSDSNETFNAYGLGLGVRAGYTFPFKLYVGGTILYHLGYSKTVSAGPFSADVSGHVMPIGAEVGYDFDAGPVTIRPNVGLGVAVLGGSGDSQTKFSLWPGVAALYNVNDQIFVGGDVRYTIVTGVDSAGSPNAFGLYANVGYRF